MKRRIMVEQIAELFEDKNTVQRIKKKLPQLFLLAKLESQRAGKTGMEVGSIRERIIVSLLIYKFSEENVKTEIPITQPEVDVHLFDKPISIKTRKGTGYSGVKLIWTVDAQNALEFQKIYQPSCDMIYAQINWNNHGGLFFIPVEEQIKLFNELGKDDYIKLPSLGTNPRGVEISTIALRNLLENQNTLKIDINWKKENIKVNPYQRWVELWKQD